MGRAPRARTALLLAGTLAVTTALAGCAEEKKAAAPQLPERTCFGVFTRSDLEPLMGDGETVTVSGPADARLTPQRRAATCTVDVDGRGRVLVAATRQPQGQSFFWPPTDQSEPAPEPLALGDKGLLWDTGARVALTCKGAEDSFELELSLSGSVEHMKPGTSRALFTSLMTKYLESAKQQTQCGV
ncbi:MULTISPECIES: hypothetical protein [Streptomyces]|uniref:DUF3558 domain-containing protein n=1 Tax=Streptomyces amritsarensis TaxID=681158 RepID=A0ABX3G4Y5_9ACTN|nr:MULTISPECIES: hypothetical protein [Streptomyces]AQT72703.1 hypothetical protein B1K54_14420 [Streptomyces sp. fd1-xmd]OLZ66714.1 hypothetical protein AVW11_14990 [Streptomyces amritsarensis]